MTGADHVIVGLTISIPLTVGVECMTTPMANAETIRYQRLRLRTKAGSQSRARS
jgi:hypothetical protein